MLAQQLFRDSTPNGLINQRILVAPFGFTDQLQLSAEQKTAFFRALLLQAKKLLAIWIHLDRYRTELRLLQRDPPVLDLAGDQQMLSVAYSQELYLEFDEFLVQYKSSLDYLAKLPGALLGTKRWNPRSFGDKGRRILRLLHNVLPSEKKKLAADFEKMIYEKHRADIEAAIEMRDKINHFIDGGVRFEDFTVIKVKLRDGKEELRVPMWNQEQTLEDFMNIAFHNHLKFCEDFIVFFLGLYLKPDYGFLHRPVDAESAKSPYHLIHEALLPLYVNEDGTAK